MCGDKYDKNISYTCISISYMLVLYNQFCDNNQKLTHSSLGIPKQFLYFANFESLVMHQCLAFVSNYIGESISTKEPHLSVKGRLLSSCATPILSSFRGLLLSYIFQIPAKVIKNKVSVQELTFTHVEIAFFFLTKLSLVLKLCPPGKQG